MPEAGGKLAFHLGDEPQPNVDLVGPEEARVCVEHQLEGLLGPRVRVEVEVDEAQPVQEGRVAPVALSAQAEELLVGRQGFGKVVQADPGEQSSSRVWSNSSSPQQAPPSLVAL